LDSITSLLQDDKISIVGLYETFLLNGSGNFGKCVSYDFTYENRIARSGRGLTFFVQNVIPWVIKNEFFFINKKVIFENRSIEIKVNTKKMFVL
jgi:hypothetical protein